MNYFSRLPLTENLKASIKKILANKPKENCMEKTGYSSSNVIDRLSMLSKEELIDIFTTL
jgi:hypothetical protein